MARWLAGSDLRYFWFTSAKGVAHRRLLRLLRDGGAVVQKGRLPFVGGLAVTPEHPELWIDYLDYPATMQLPGDTRWSALPGYSRRSEAVGAAGLECLNRQFVQLTL